MNNYLSVKMQIYFVIVIKSCNFMVISILNTYYWKDYICLINRIEKVRGHYIGYIKKPKFTFLLPSPLQRIVSRLNAKSFLIFGAMHNQVPHNLS